MIMFMQFEQITEYELIWWKVVQFSTTYSMHKLMLLLANFLWSNCYYIMTILL